MPTAKQIMEEEQAEKDQFLREWSRADDILMEKILPKLPEAAREGFVHLVKKAEFISPEWEREWGNHDVVVAGYDEFFRGDTRFKAIVGKLDELGFLEEGAPEPGKD